MQLKKDSGSHLRDQNPDNNRYSVEVPRPLQITKRVDSQGAQSFCSRARRSSSGSVYSNNSRRSTPEPPGGDLPLNIPKRRDTRGSQTSSSIGSGPGFVDFTSGASRLSRMKPGERTGMVISDHIFPIPPRSLRDDNMRINTANEAAMSSPLSSISNFSLQEREHSADSTTDRDDSGITSQLAAASEATMTTIPESPELITPNKQDQTRHWLRNSRSMFQLAPRDESSQNIDEEELYSPHTVEFESDPRDSIQDPPYRSDPCILTPHIVVTPQTKALDDGTNSLWATIQVSTQISRPSESNNLGPEYGWIPPDYHDEGLNPQDPFQYGCLYDVSVVVLPTSKSEIIEVLDEKACEKTALYPGSRLLVVAHVRLLPEASTPQTRRARGHVRQSSDDLMEDLENALGSTMVEYLSVRVIYRHSAFPTRDTPLRAVDGVIKVQSSLVTTAVAAIKRQNTKSPWGPRPAPQPNPLFEIIASHWGPESASDVMHRIMSLRYASRRTANASPSPASGSSAQFAPSLPPRSTLRGRRVIEPAVHPRLPAPPPIPRRHASLNKFEPPVSCNQDRAALPQQLTMVGDRSWTELSAPPTTQSEQPDSGYYSTSYVDAVTSSSTIMPVGTFASTRPEISGDLGVESAEPLPSLTAVHDFSDNGHTAHPRPQTSSSKYSTSTAGDVVVHCDSKHENVERPKYRLIPPQSDRQHPGIELSKRVLRGALLGAEEHMTRSLPVTPDPRNRLIDPEARLSESEPNSSPIPIVGRDDQQSEASRTQDTPKAMDANDDEILPVAKTATLTKKMQLVHRASTASSNKTTSTGRKSADVLNSHQSNRSGTTGDHSLENCILSGVSRAREERNAERAAERERKKKKEEERAVEREKQKERDAEKLRQKMIARANKDKAASSPQSSRTQEEDSKEKTSKEGGDRQQSKWNFSGLFGSG